MASPDARRAELAKIHIAMKQLGMDRDTYEAMLWTIARVKSAGDLNSEGRQQVLEHMKSRGFKPVQKKAPKYASQRGSKPAVPADRQGQIGKIEALLADAGRPWEYVEGMARRMGHVDALRFCTPEQLGKLIAALVIDQRRRAAKTNPPA